MVFFVVELDGAEHLSKRWNSLEVVLNKSFFGGTLITFENGYERLFGKLVDIEAGRFNIGLFRSCVKIGVRRIVFTGVFDFCNEMIEKSVRFSKKPWNVVEGTD